MVAVSLGLGIGDMMEAVRDRVEVSGHDASWQITAGSFDDALGYARDRFAEPIVLARRDRSRWWPRVTLVVTTDPDLADEAPPLDELAREPEPPAQPEYDDRAATPDPESELPAALEAIFAHQDVPRPRSSR